MSSLAVYAHDYLLHADTIEGMGPFDHRFLAEGDSWMDRSSLMQLSLPYYLAMELGRRGKSVLIIDIAHLGDTLRRITDAMGGEFMWWLRQFTYDGILFSAGGNDFMDAARDTPPGQGLLRNMAGQPLPANGYDCVDQAALASLVDGFLDPNFDKLCAAIRASANNAATPIYLNGYDTPVARNVPAAPGIGPWLYTAYRKNAIDPSLWKALTEGVFADVKRTVATWSKRHPGVVAVPTTGLLRPADPQSPGSSGDWANEIHPNAAGWAKQAKAWATALGF